MALLFSFILLVNLFSIIPFFQISPNAHIAFPIILALISYVMFNYIGIKRHGLHRLVVGTVVDTGAARPCCAAFMKTAVEASCMA
jgi:F-type H+-transporting ATPase subunit a